MSSETDSELRSAQAATPPPAPDAGAAGTGGTPGDDGVVGLPAREREILAFERQWWRFAGAKEEAIRERFGMSATRYYQVLNALVDRPEALAVDPLLVRRLRRMRGARQRQRSGRVLGSDPLRD
ncbi:DUF3263 domain-containing protein [Modestobacter excelsi]|uniref:DUF3263 domain-containing protein n=1 Tax=Modestobacter excelsi TaxID=2213161 RepID=UPI00110D0C2A|nr:DUF3263 domain-containing protein [Modestobacter excelsi]